MKKVFLFLLLILIGCVKNPVTNTNEESSQTFVYNSVITPSIPCIDAFWFDFRGDTVWQNIGLEWTDSIEVEKAEIIFKVYPGKNSARWANKNITLQFARDTNQQWLFSQKFISADSLYTLKIDTPFKAKELVFMAIYHAKLFKSWQATIWVKKT